MPVGVIQGKGIGSQRLLYVENISLDRKLTPTELEQVVQSLSEIYRAYKELGSYPPEIKIPRRAALRKEVFRYHLRLQYAPTIAQEIYTIIQGERGNFYENIDDVGRKISKIAYKK